LIASLISSHLFIIHTPNVSPMNIRPTKNRSPIAITVNASSEIFIFPPCKNVLSARQ
jgi:hypothetical protein